MKQTALNDCHRDILIIPDTSALPKGFQLLINIFHHEKIKWKLPSIVISELDKIKDNKKHKENRNAHKILSSLKSVQYEITKEIYKHKNNDNNIIATAKMLQNNGHEVFIVSEDKTFKLKLQNT